MFFGETRHETPCPNPECDNVIIWYYMPPTSCPSCLTDLGLDEFGRPYNRTCEPTVEDYSELNETKPERRGEDQ